MRYLLIFFISAFFAGNLYCETVNTKVENNCFPKVYQFINDRSYEEAIRILEEEIPSLSQPDYLGEAYFSLAYSHDQLGRPLKAIGYYMLSTEHYEKPVCISNALENIGLIYKRFNQHEQAIFYFSKALHYDQGETKGRMKRLYRRATALRRSDRISLAIDDLLEAEAIAYELKQEDFRAKIYNQLGLLYKFKGDLGKARSYYYLALQIAETGDIYHNFGNLKMELGDSLGAEKYYLKAIEMASGQTLINVTMDLGELYYLRGKQQQAEHYLLQAATYFNAGADVTFDHVRLFKLLADVVEDTELATEYREKAIEEYEKFGANLLKSNELFFGAVAEQKIKNLEIKRDIRETTKDHLMVFIALSILLLIAIVWLLLRIRRGIKDKRIRRAFKDIENVLYEE